MQRQISYRWLLRDVMADHGMFATTALSPLLSERGIDLSPSQIHRLVTGTPERLSLTVLAALCDIFECTPADLVQTSAHTVATRKAAGAGGGGKVVDLAATGRPKRARLRSDDS
ncbi:MAG: helix-turn-helix domain-containing protein [Sporichthyaceae bacterium]